jgi:hypothetical protein
MEKMMMKRIRSDRSMATTRRTSLSIIAIFCCTMLWGCDYKVALTPKPTRKLIPELCGNWISKEGESKMKVQRLDDYAYVVHHNRDLFKVYHSDFSGTPFLSVQSTDPEGSKYAYSTWKLSSDKKRLTLCFVNNDVVPKETPDLASIQALVIKNLQNPKLFNDEQEYIRE